MAKIFNDFSTAQFLENKWTNDVGEPCDEQLASHVWQVELIDWVTEYAFIKFKSLLRRGWDLEKGEFCVTLKLLLLSHAKAYYKGGKIQSNVELPKEKNTLILASDLRHTEQYEFPKLHFFLNFNQIQ